MHTDGPTPPAGAHTSGPTCLEGEGEEDAKNGEKGKGRGGGRGRGRGGKGGRGKKAAVEPQGESTMDEENVSSKRAAEATPPPKVSAEQPRDEVDDMQTPVRNLDAALDAEANPGVTASPAIKQPKKRAKNSRATKSTAAKSKAAPRASQKKKRSRFGATSGKPRMQRIRMWRNPSHRNPHPRT